MAPVVICGGGLAGIFSALLLKSRFPEQSVLLIEGSPTLGGLLKSYTYSAGCFDHGAHNISETGVTLFDDWLNQWLLEERQDWQKLSGPRRDLAGVFINDILQTHTQYIDLRNWPEQNYQAYLSDFFLNLQHLSAPPFQSALDRSIHQFGTLISQDIISPVVEKIFSDNLSQLSPAVLDLIPLQRVALYDETIASDLTLSPLLRSRIAYTQQRNLPEQRSSQLSSFYPCTPGIGALIDVLQDKLKAADVQLLTSAQLLSFTCQSKRVTSIHIQHENTRQTLDVKALVWAAGLPLLYRLWPDAQSLTRGPGMSKLVLAHYCLADKPAVEDLYYYYCYDKKYQTYRVCFYHNYSHISKNGAFPITVEYFLKEDSPHSDQDLSRFILSELQQMGVVSDAKPLFSQIERPRGGIPSFHLKTTQSLNIMRETIVNTQPQNLVLVGSMAKEALFFQRDILRHVYQSLKEVEF